MKQRFLEFGSADDLDERIRDEEGRPHGGDPVAVCIRVNGETAEDGVTRAREMLSFHDGRAKIEDVGDGHVRVILYEDPDTGEYVTLYANLNNLVPERDDDPEAAEEMEDDDAGPEA